MNELVKLIPDFKKFILEFPKNLKQYKIDKEKDRLSLKTVVSNYDEWCAFIELNVSEEILDQAEIHMNQILKTDWGEHSFMLFDRKMKKAYAVNKKAGYMMHLDSLEIEEL